MQAIKTYLNIPSEHTLHDPRESVNFHAAAEIRDILNALKPAFQRLGLHFDLACVIYDFDQNFVRVPMHTDDQQYDLPDEQLCSLTAYLRLLSEALVNPDKVSRHGAVEHGNPKRTKESARMLGDCERVAKVLENTCKIYVGAQEEAPVSETLTLSPQGSTTYRDAKERLRPATEQPETVIKPIPEKQINGKYWVLDEHLLYSDKKSIRDQIASGKAQYYVGRWQSRSLSVLELVRPAEEHEIPKVSRDIFTEQEALG